MTGEELYRQWCGDPQGVTDRARYWPMMNPADKQAWEELAAVTGRETAKADLLKEVIQGVRDGLAQAFHGSPKIQSVLDTLDRAIRL